MKSWRPSVPDEQMIAEARAEDLARSIVRWETSAGGLCSTGYDAADQPVVLGCRGPLQRDHDLELQARAGVESQDRGADDEVC